MTARITSIVFDQNENPLRAYIHTSSGTVKVVWIDVCGQLGWFSSGCRKAKILAVPVIERIERMMMER